MATHQQHACAVAVALMALPGFIYAGGHDPDKQVVYKTVGDTELQLYVFTPDQHHASDRRACVVFFFGGGWNGGTPSQFYPHCRYFATRGMVAMSADYRVKSRHGTTPYECVRDGRSAIRWVRQHADELGIDPERIAAGGGSAGGHVAAATAASKRIDEPLEDESVSARPDALILFNPVFDNGPGGYGHERLGEHWRDVSPMHNITPDSPPTIVFLGTKDRLIPADTARTYKRRMTDADVRCDLHLYEGQRHGFFNYRKGRNKYFDVTASEADRFLVSLGLLEKPTPDTE